MPHEFILWDLDDDPSGNVQHIAEHGVTQDEVEQVLLNPTDADTSHSSGLPVVFGKTDAGRLLIVVYEAIDDATTYPVTAYDIEDGADR